MWLICSYHYSPQNKCLKPMGVECSLLTVLCMQHRPIIAVNFHFWCFSYLLHNGMHKKTNKWGVTKHQRCLGQNKTSWVSKEPWTSSHPKGIFSGDKVERVPLVRFLWCSKNRVHTLLSYSNSMTFHDFAWPFQVFQEHGFSCQFEKFKNLSLF